MRSAKEATARLNQIRSKWEIVSVLLQEELKKPMRLKGMTYVIFLIKETSSLEAAMSELEWLLAKPENDPPTNQPGI